MAKKIWKLVNQLVESYTNYEPAAVVVTDGVVFFNAAIKRDYEHNVSLVCTVFYLEDGMMRPCGCSVEGRFGKQYYRDDIDPKKLYRGIEDELYRFSEREGINFFELI